jgi:hypothetical protein
MPDIAVWDLFFKRGYDDGAFRMDPEAKKVIQIYAYSRMEGGETLMRLGLKRDAVRQLMIAARLAPEYKPHIDEVLGVNKLNKKSDR